MSLVVNGTEFGPGVLVSYCWSSVATVCAGGSREEPPMYVVRASQDVVVQIRTKSGVRELRASVTPSDPRGSAQKASASADAQTVEPVQAAASTFGVGIHYFSVFTRWDRGDATFLFGLRVEPG